MKVLNLTDEAVLQIRGIPLPCFFNDVRHNGDIEYYAIEQDESALRLIPITELFTVQTSTDNQFNIICADAKFLEL